MTPRPGQRPVWAEIDLGAIAHNVQRLGEVVGVPLMAVVKADGYGHGAVPVARAALAAGAERLAVAIVEEAAELRAAGIGATIHLLSEPPPSAARDVVSLRLIPSVYTAELVTALATQSQGVITPVHLKVDTGMHRVGANPEEALTLATMIDGAPGLSLDGVWTHLAVAEEIGNPATARQLGLFGDTLSALAAKGLRPALVHAANSAGALAVPDSRFDLARVGISLYGVLPAPHFLPDPGLHPAMSLHARVSLVKRLPAGERVSYGLTYELPHEATIATVPIGYADGFPRRLSNRAHALVLGKRVKVAGTVTMDQILLDCGDLPVRAGDEVVLLGRQGEEEVTAGELAEALGTIAYEVLCGIGKRVPRVYLPAR
jgi:alanine racemase